MTAGFPDPRGGHGRGAPATTARRFPVERRGLTEGKFEFSRRWRREFDRWKFANGGGALIGWRKKRGPCYWPIESNAVLSVD